MLEGCKVVTASEMVRIEALACKEGTSELHFMENAGNSIAQITADFIHEQHLGKKVSLLAGKGNNGGDAFAAGCALLDKGFSVTAWHIYPLRECSSLCQEMCKRFQKKGGKVVSLSEENIFKTPLEGVILDGLVGTGFKGKAEGALALGIESANHSGNPILALDIPSGVNGTTGAVETVAIHATMTIYLELPKMGFFLKEGWDHTGELVQAGFGLGEKYIELAIPAAHLFDIRHLAHFLPKVKRTRHKYQAGYVLAYAGSKDMPGAAILSSYSTLVSGAGIVRLFHPKGMQAELSGAPYELIKEEWDGKSFARLKEESQRAQAILVGPGMGRTKSAFQAIQTVLKHSALPTVIDADALYFLARNPKCSLPVESVLTPHHGEMNTLLSTFKTKGADPIQEYVDHKKVTLVLKGAPTCIFHPKMPPLIVARGSPGMATAGSGDVLTGMIASMLAQGLPPRTAACVAVALHALAGEIAEEHLTPYCMTAASLLEFLPDAFVHYGKGMQ